MRYNNTAMNIATVQQSAYWFTDSYTDGLFRVLK